MYLVNPVAGHGTSYHQNISISAPGCWKLLNCQKLRDARNVLTETSPKLMHIYNGGERDKCCNSN